MTQRSVDKRVISIMLILGLIVSMVSGIPATTTNTPNTSNTSHTNIVKESNSNILSTNSNSNILHKVITKDDIKKSIDYDSLQTESINTEYSFNFTRNLFGQKCIISVIDGKVSFTCNVPTPSPSPSPTPSPTPTPTPTNPVVPVIPVVPGIPNGTTTVKPVIGISLINNNNINVKKGTYFNISVNVTCKDSDCGNVYSYLDPEQVPTPTATPTPTKTTNNSPATKNITVKDSKTGYIIEFTDTPSFTYTLDKEKQIEMLSENLNNNAYTNSNENLVNIKDKVNNLKKQIKDSITLQEKKILNEHIEFKKVMQQRLSPGVSLLSDDKNSVILGEYSKVYNGIALNITKEQAEKLKDLPNVKSIVPNEVYHVNLDTSIDWLNVDDVWQSKDSSGTNLTGKGVKIAMIDSGVEITHAMFGNSNNPVFTKCTDFAHCPKVLDSWDFVSNNAEPWDQNGHGTHTASTAAGINDGVLKGGMAPDAKLYIYRVCDSSGACNMDYIVQAIERAIDPNNDGNYADHANIISMSLGGDGNADCPSCKAINNAADLGVISIISAGNSGPTASTVACPACAEKAIAVAAGCKPDQVGKRTECSNYVASFSSRGPYTYNGVDYQKPDIMAPGVLICAARKAGFLGNSKYPTCFDDNHVRVSGTSMAAPEMAGIAALIVQKNPSITHDEFKKLIQSTATKMQPYSFNDQGAGLVNPAAIFGITPTPTPTPVTPPSNSSNSTTPVTPVTSPVTPVTPVVPVTKGIISTSPNAKPFYSLDRNPNSCNLKKDGSCIVNWRVVATGDINTSWEFFAFAKTNTNSGLNVTTSKIKITIT